MATEEPSTFFFDKKDAKYYRNQSLNNCKTRTRYISKLYNSLISCKNIIDRILELEDKKDYYVSKDENIKNIKNNMDDIFNYLETYKNNLDTEMQDLLARDFEKIAEENISKIRAKENEKNCEELYK